MSVDISQLKVPQGFTLETYLTIGHQNTHVLYQNALLREYHYQSGKYKNNILLFYVDNNGSTKSIDIPDTVQNLVAKTKELSPWAQLNDQSKKDEADQIKEQIKNKVLKYITEDKDILKMRGILSYASSFKSLKLDLTVLSTDIIRVKNTSSVTLLSNPNEAYLVSYHNLVPGQKMDGFFKFTRASSHKSVNDLNQGLFLGTCYDLYQRVGNDLETDFRTLGTQDHAYGPTSRALDFNGFFGKYYWEAFFHVPFYIANRLNSQHKYAEARKWYHYIFNPTIGDNKSPYHFPPFKQITSGMLCDGLTEQRVIGIYHNDILDPHAIAELRPIAYMKAVVMHYIKNLIDWGDDLFSSNVREAITQAINLYMMANDLLGQKPERLGPEKRDAVITFDDYYLNIRGERNLAYNGISLSVMKKLENRVVFRDSSVAARVEMNEINPYFSLPENRDFIDYWDRVADRLFKIRYSLNMQGVLQKIDLFAPELDVRQLVRAAASLEGGQDIQSLMPYPVPLRRFLVLLEYAKSFTHQVIQLGSSLLAALERHDSEKLMEISNQQQAVLLDQVSAIKQQQKEQAARALDQINENLNAALQRKDYYDGLIKVDLLSSEINAQSLRTASQAFSADAATLSGISTLLFAIPELEDGVDGAGIVIAASFGGQQLGFAAQSASSTLSEISAIRNAQAEDQITSANYERRRQEWDQQKQQAESEIVVVTQQVKMSEIQSAIADKECDNHQQLIDQHREIADYYRDKFTNLELYSWYCGQLVMLYRQTYEIAVGTARSAERAYQFELNCDGKSFLSNNYYSFFRKGLLAGESLMLDLNRMEKSYLEDSRRLLEIEKTISFSKQKVNADKNGETKGDGNTQSLSYLQKKLGDFKKNGVVEFELKSDMFDEDFENHYNRRIKRVSVSLSALTQPFQNVNLILTQISSTIKTTPDKEMISPKMGEQIVISTGLNDHGLFESSLQDPRYLPFEGTGVTSKWRLEIAGKNDDKKAVILKSISDIVINLQYTAEAGLNKSMVNRPSRR